MKAFILSYNDPRIPDQDMVDFLDSRPEVLNWFTFLPNTIFLTSSRDIEVLTKIIGRKFPSTFFLISEYNSKKANGALTDEAWDFLNKPKSA